MRIDPTILKEVNYVGSRLVDIEDETIAKLHAEKVEILESEKKPILDKMTELEKPLQVFYDRLTPIESERSSIKEEMKPLSEEYSKEVEKIEAVQQKIDSIDQKINIIANDKVKSELGEFETARTLHVKNGKFSIEVIDEIEELVKKIRSNVASR
jgi:predicted nuclease with TOPRIM domain